MEEEETECTCRICYQSFKSTSPQWKSLSGCKHSFCKDCLGDYISDCADSKSYGLAILCPHHECNLPLSPLEIAELSPSSQAYDQLLETENKNFVVSKSINMLFLSKTEQELIPKKIVSHSSLFPLQCIIEAKDVRFCPHPGCEGIVKFISPLFAKKAKIDPALLHTVGAVCSVCRSDDENLSDCAAIPRTYEGVPDPNYKDCRSSQPPRKAHRFCFCCGEQGFHWPVTCSRLADWKVAVEEQELEVRDGHEEGDTGNYNDLAQKLWLKTNTRPCPKVSLLIGTKRNHAGRVFHSHSCQFS